MIGPALLHNGLFGGLCTELQLDSAGILKHVNDMWRVSSPVVSLRDLDAWHRGGAETYIAHAIMSHQGSDIQVVGKAFVAWGPPPESQRIAWELRRASLEREGVRVPQVFSSERALTVEEFIPYTIERGSLSSRQAYELGRTVRAMLALGLRPLNIWSDVRSTGDDVVYIDFGSDIIADTDGSWPFVVESEMLSERRDAFRLGLLDKSVKH